MRGEKKKKKNKYCVEYKENELKLKIEKGIKLKIDLNNNVEVGVLLAKFRQAKLGSSRELGRVFKRSASTVINKSRCQGSKDFIDNRRQKKKYKIEEIQTEILLVWVKKPAADDREIFAALESRLSGLGIKLDLKTLQRYFRDAGLDEVRSRLRAESVAVNRNIDNGEETIAGRNAVVVVDRDNACKEEITRTPSRYAGQMLHVPALYRMGFSQMVKVLPSPEEPVYSKEKVGYQLYRRRQYCFTVFSLRDWGKKDI